MRSGRDLWDFGPVAVVRGESSIVLGLGDLEVLERHASEADRAVNAVSEVWGTSWAQRIVVIAPSDTAQLAAILGGSDGDYDQIAAVTTGHFLTGHTATSADRVLLNPDAFAELSSVGRRVVLTHETTHVAARAASTGSLPAWLSEGFADYVGFRNSEVRCGSPRRTCCGKCGRTVRRRLCPLMTRSSRRASRLLPRTNRAGWRAA